MKLKRKDLDLLMQYVSKEKPELVDVALSDDGNSYRFSFEDSSRVVCTIRLYNSAIGATPDLLKTTKLYTVKDEK
jgi:hypothetical protein